MKKFKNLWAMGLILWIGILVGFYFIKLLFPSFIIGIAHYEPIVKFGMFVQNHKWAFYLYTFMLSMFVYYFYCCACCRRKSLTFKEILLISAINILLYAVQIVLPTYYIYFNIMSLIILPCLLCALNKETDIKMFYSTTIVFILHLASELISLKIRDLEIMIINPNIATLTILTIDAYIWLVLLYNYYNYKEVRRNGY